MRMKKLFLTQLFSFLILTLGFALPSFSASDTKIGFVDMQKAVTNTKEWKKEFNDFKNNFQKEKTIIADKEKAIRQALEELNKQGLVLSPDVKRQKEENFAKDKRDFERYIQDRNEEFSKKESELKDKLLKKMVKIVQGLGKEKKYTMILEQSAVFYSSADDDLTDLAIKAYDKATP